MIKKRDGIVGCLLFLFTVFVFRGLERGFLQQDEWASLGIFLAKGPLWSLTSVSPLLLLTGRMRIVGTLTNDILRFFWPMGTLQFVFFGLIAHWLNGFLLYLLLKDVVKNRIIALASALVFLVSGVSFQAVIWFAATTTSIPVVTFLLFSLLFVRKGLEKNNFTYIALSALFFILSIMTKETAFIGFILLPGIVLFSRARIARRRRVWFSAPFFGYLILTFLVRGVEYYTNTVHVYAYVAPTSGGIGRILLQACIYPFIGFSQSFFPRMWLLKLADRYQVFVYPFMAGTTMQSVVLENITSDIASLVVTAVLLLGTVVIIAKERKYSALIIGGEMALLGSFIPFAFIIRGGSFFDSRYLYLPALWVACIIAGLLTSIYRLLGRKKLGIRIIGYIGLSIVFTVFIFKQSQVVSRAIGSDIQTADTRREIISQFRTLFPLLPSKTVIYILGPPEGYYGIAGNPLPFQHGFGYTVMIYNFQNRNTVTQSLLGNTTFYDVHEQGYYDDGQYGFGYFYDYDMLRDYINRRVILPDQVIAIFYHKENNRLEDITQDIRTKLIRQNTVLR